MWDRESKSEGYSGNRELKGIGVETGGAEHAAPVFFFFFMGVGGGVEMLRDIGNVSYPSYLMMAVMHC